MPLTFAHPAIVLPLNYLPKRWVSLTGLIVGSITPDFEYFIRMRVYSIYSHTWLGLFWFNLPLGILLTFVYHGIVRNMLLVHMPGFLKRRFYNFNSFNWVWYFKNNTVVVITSILVGAASHLLWDSFTHATGYFVVNYHMLTPVIICGVSLPVYKIIQHISTLTGAIVIIITIFKLKVMPFNKPDLYNWYWPLVLLVLVVIVLLRIICGLSLYRYTDIMVSGVSGLVTGFILVPLFFSTFLTKETL